MSISPPTLRFGLSCAYNHSMPAHTCMFMLITVSGDVNDTYILCSHLRAGVCRSCVETELTATKKSATDGN